MSDGASGGHGARNAIWIAAVILALLHQDLWFWNDTTLVMGFMPVGLFYHALFSLAAAGLWAAAIRFAWPHHIERWADETDGPGDATP